MFAIGYIGYGLAYPIVQSSLFVSGLWGIFLFDEMKGGKNRALFWLSGAFLVVGASLLTLSK
jgi:glucose uptake protein GlcU